MHPNACLFGVCNNLVNAYSCSCNGSFSGHRCQNVPNFCASNSCMGNICYNSVDDQAARCHCEGPYFQQSGVYLLSILLDILSRIQNLFFFCKIRPFKVCEAFVSCYVVSFEYTVNRHNCSSPSENSIDFNVFSYFIFSLQEKVSCFSWSTHFIVFGVIRKVNE